MFRICIVILFVCTFSTVCAQWTRTDSFGVTDYPTKILRNPMTGNVYVVGTALDDSGFGSSKIFIVKYSPSGQILDEVAIPGTTFAVARDAALDAQGNLYITGADAPICHYSENQPPIRWLLVQPWMVTTKFNPDLHVMETHRYRWDRTTGIRQETQPFALAVGHDGQVFVTGSATDREDKGWERAVVVRYPVSGWHNSTLNERIFSLAPPERREPARGYAISVRSVHGQERVFVGVDSRLNDKFRMVGLIYDTQLNGMLGPFYQQATPNEDQRVVRVAGDSQGAIILTGYDRDIDDIDGIRWRTLKFNSADEWVSTFHGQTLYGNRPVNLHIDDSNDVHVSGIADGGGGFTAALIKLSGSSGTLLRQSGFEGLSSEPADAVFHADTSAWLLCHRQIQGGGSESGAARMLADGKIGWFGYRTISEGVPLTNSVVADTDLKVYVTRDVGRGSFQDTTTFQDFSDYEAFPQSVVFDWGSTSDSSDFSFLYWIDSRRWSVTLGSPPGPTDPHIRGTFVTYIPVSALSKFKLSAYVGTSTFTDVTAKLFVYNYVSGSYEEKDSSVLVPGQDRELTYAATSSPPYIGAGGEMRVRLTWRKATMAISPWRATINRVLWTVQR